MAACAAARGAGVWAGMALAQARALCPDLNVAPWEPQRDLWALRHLACWTTRFSPVVMPDPPDALLLDVGGCERLFGGLPNLVREVSAGLATLRLSARVAVAPTAGAAWAIASCGDEGGRIVSSDELAEALAPLPPAALRIDPPAAAMLHRLGVETLGQLERLPRDALPARFGAGLLRRLDRAYGRADDDPLVPVARHAPVRAAMDFDGVAVGSLEVLWLAFERLLSRVVAELRRTGCGARRVDLEFCQAHAPPVTRSIVLSSPSRDTASLFHLLRCATESVRSAGEGFTGVALSVPAVERVSAEQLALLGDEEQHTRRELGRLVEVLCARIGTESVRRAELVESHRPERAYRLVEAIAPSSESGERPLIESLDEASPRPSSRPLRLLPVPAEVPVTTFPRSVGGETDASEGVTPVSFTYQGRVNPVAHAIGPERIAGVWWEGRVKSRDYYDALTSDGRRYWLFRVAQTGKWYVHGIFE